MASVESPPHAGRVFVRKHEGDGMLWLGRVAFGPKSEGMDCLFVKQIWAKMRHAKTDSVWVRLAARQGVLGVLAFLSLGAITMEDLRQDPHLTPERFARYFSNFRYEFHVEVQRPEVFLSTQRGDCDDFATLAADVLREKGYHPRLIAVRMPGLVHVVCYIEETKNYLDYNNRGYLKRTVGSDGTLKDVAKKVARSFDASWTSASEFTYANGLKQIGATISQTEVYVTTQPLVLSPPKKLDLNF